ncbi:hypothetical protein ZIOFF_052123 [Zingiber officinale]|uniref:WD repeat-containing protein 75 second beta-propeller domain-containing protein n=1 Tax=Zingiber officinale TaxID=94328 RepID=A0A8J5FNQ4_ZINOF|nr:hypothetical protein ZIOFF_052123 [Zingiber officinale]
MALQNSSHVSNFPLPMMKLCGICSSQDHSSDHCPNLHQDESVAAISRPQFQQHKYDPNSSTYNPGWRDHPNLRYGNTFYQQPTQNQIGQPSFQHQQNQHYFQNHPAVHSQQNQHFQQPQFQQNFNQNQQFQPFQNFQHSNVAFQPQFQNAQNQQNHFQQIQQPVQNFQQPSNANQHQSQLALPSSTSPRSMQPQQNFSSSKIEDLMQQVLQQQQQMMQQQQHQQRTDTALQNIERQIGQLASNINQMQNQGSGQLPSQPTPNPKGNVSALTLRSGKTILDPNPNFTAGAQQNISRPFAASSSQNFQNFPANSEQPDSAQNGITGFDQQHFNQPEVSDSDQINGADFGLEFTPTADSNSAPNSAQNLENSAQNRDRTFNQQEAEHSTPLPFPQRSVQPRKEMEEEKAREYQELVKLFSKVEVNVPLLTMIKQIPKYAKFLKDLCVHKKKLKGNELISMGKNVSALLQPVPQKCEDPGVFTVPCVIGDCIFEDAMLDLGASINVMPKSVFQSLRIGPLQPTGVVIQLANRSQAHPAGVIEDVLVKVRELIFPADFYILDMEGDVLANRAPLILGRPFLKTARTKIDVHAGTLSMEIGDTVVRFSIFEAMKHPREDHSILSVDISEELDGMEFLSEIDSDLEISDFGTVNEFVALLEDVLDVESDVNSSECVGDCLGEALPLGSLREEEVSCSDNHIHLLKMPTMDISKSISGIKPPFSFPLKHEGSCTQVAFEQTTGLVAVSTEDYCVQFYSLFDNHEVSEKKQVLMIFILLLRSKCAKEIFSLQMTLCDAQVSSLAFRPGHNMAVTSSYGGDFKVWVHGSHADRNNESIQRTGWRCQSVGSYKGKSLTAAAFSADGSVLAIAAETIITLWDPDSNILVAMIGDTLSPITKLSFVGESEYLVSYTHGLKPQLSVWSTSNLALYWSHGIVTEAVSCSHDESQFAVLALLSSAGDADAKGNGVIFFFDVEDPVPMAT